MFKVEIRKNCKICGGVLSKRHRTYCSSGCSNKGNYEKYKGYRRTWQKKKWERESGKYEEGRLQCKICGKWYVQVGTHIVQKHGMTAREYREEYNLPVKRGITPMWYRIKKGKQALENGTVENLKNGKKFWYKKGDYKAKVMTFYKGRRYKSDEYYN